MAVLELLEQEYPRTVTFSSTQVRSVVLSCEPPAALDPVPGRRRAFTRERGSPFRSAVQAGTVDVVIPAITSEEFVQSSPTSST